MHQTAKIFMTGRSQAVRLPVEFRFDVEEVFIRRDPIYLTPIVWRQSIVVLRQANHFVSRLILVQLFIPSAIHKNS